MPTLEEIMQQSLQNQKGGQTDGGMEAALRRELQATRQGVENNSRRIEKAARKIFTLPKTVIK